MSYVGVATTILSHIVASLYMQKQKYNKLVTCCLWGVYVVLAVGILLLNKNIIFGFFALFFLHLLFFHITTVGSIRENTFLFLTYANSFCIYIGANCILSAFLGDSIYLPICTTVVLVLIHLFLYKILIPTYKKSKAFFSSGWWRLNIVLILFWVQFLKQYAFSIVDKSSAGNLIFDFVIFSVIFYSTLVLLFNLVRDSAEKNKLKSVAYVDALTNLQNRTAYNKFTRRFLSNKADDGEFIFVILDIDNFKNINDTKGHIEGDRVLKEVGSFISKYFEDLPCESFRIGGDEFVLLLEDESLAVVENQIRKMNEDLFNTVGVTLSYGCTEVDFNDAKPFDLAFKTADEIMYSNKQQKKIHS